MPEWLIERGIGEMRAALVEQGEIVEARIIPEGVVPAGTILAAKLCSTRPAVARAGEDDYLLPAWAPGITEGATLAIEVVREAIGTEAWKRPLARVSAEAPRPAPTLEGDTLPFPAPRDQLAEAGWHDLLDEARSGMVAFAGGMLRITPTPAMTLIDVDGTLPPAELALASARSAARAIPRLGIAGSIGIDFPTVAGKGPRQAIAEAFDAHLPPPFERTAVNGFGFLQIIRPRRHASLLELSMDRASFEARALLRRAAFHAGAVTIAAHPVVIAAIKPEWNESLARQVGGAVTLRADPSLAMSGGHAH